MIVSIYIARLESRIPLAGSTPTELTWPLPSTDVAAHPEHRKFVFPENKANDPSGLNQQQNQREPPGLYNRDGKLKHPERSAYYDPVFNPFGAPPPGMPYRERRKQAATARAHEPTNQEMV